MGILDSLFGSKKEKKVSKNNTDSTKNIRFKENLIDLLEEDHQSLFKLYGSMLENSKLGNYDIVVDNLKDFKTELGMHVYIENIQLYTYIKNYYHSEKEQLQMIENIQSDMDSIVKAVSDFSENWVSVGIEDDNVDEFIKGLEEIGGVLTKRTTMEETRLYILYQN